MCADDGSAERRRAESAADVVVDGHAAAPAAVANAIADLGVEMLVDMCGHAGSADVLEVVARRPARINVAGQRRNQIVLGRSNPH